MDIKGKKITILGGKRSGQALARLGARLGAQVSISEKSALDSIDPTFLAWASNQGIPIEAGGHTPGFCAGSAYLLLSPGVPQETKIVRWAHENHMAVVGEIEFAAQWCERPIIAVTGSNGKTTVVTLIQDLLTLAGYRTCLCGNVGTPFSSLVLDLQDKDYVILEVSSFQLQSIRRGCQDGVRGFKPHVAVLLNCTDNHLDRHKDFQEYLQAKSRIFFNQDEGDYAVVGIPLESLRKGMPEIPKMRGLLRPLTALSDKDEWRSYNANERAVLEVANILRVPGALCREVFMRFSGVEHRCEKIAEIQGVTFINDAKSTTAEATRWALHQIKGAVVLICGGRDKNIDYRVLQEAFRDRVIWMFVIGEARDKIKGCFQMICPVVPCMTLEEAVHKAYDTAKYGETVLLSPMCASFDMFENFEHRGQVFKSIVSKIEQHQLLKQA